MSKNKIIALAIIAFLIIVPFQFAYINFSIESQFLQSIMMTVVIVGAIIAIFMFNKDTEKSSH